MKLYRAVGDAEFEDLLRSGRFRATGNSVEGKYFAEQLGHAVAWGEALYGSGRYRIVETEVPDPDAEAFFRWDRLDAIGPARFARVEQLTRAPVREVTP
jgi:hypothetical protein